MKMIILAWAAAAAPIVAFVGPGESVPSFEPQATASPTKLYWYRLDLDNEPDLVGSSMCSPAEIPAMLAKGEFVGFSS